MNHRQNCVLSAPGRMFLSLLVATAIAPLPAQGLRWSDPTVQPTLHAHEHADRSWSLCFDGLSMSAAIPLNASNQAAAIGVDGSARAVSTSSADVLKGGEGDIASSVLFPFAVDARVPDLFRMRMPNLHRFGLLAPITGSVPEAGLASIRFRLQLAQPLPASEMVMWLANTRLGLATTDEHVVPTGRVFVLSPAGVQLSRVLYYLFDRGAGDEEINAAGIEGGASSRATLKRGSGTPWTSGRFGSGLRAGTTVDTGYPGDLGARFTVAWFMRGNVAPTGVSPIFALGNWRMFTGGAAGTGMRCTGMGGATNFDLAADVQGLAALGWVHVALVVDGDLGQAKWYVNGQSAGTIPMSATVTIPASPSPMTIGSTPAFANVYDLDEFRLSAEAVSAATIAQWANGSSRAALPFTGACGASLRSRRVPAPGNYVDYCIEATPGSPVRLTLGAGARLGGAPLPVDLGLVDPALAGCAWYSDLSILFPTAVVPASGILTVPLSLPNESWLRGVEIYAQALVFGAGGLRATNAHMISIQ